MNRYALANGIYGVLACSSLMLPITVCATVAASLEQLVCGGSDVVIAEILRGHGVESGYGRDCDLTIPLNGSCKMVKLTVEIHEILGEREHRHDHEMNGTSVAVGQMVNLISYVGELLPAGKNDDGLQAASPAHKPLSDTEVVGLFAGKHFIFSFDRKSPYPPGSEQFYSAVFPLDRRAAIQQILSAPGGIPFCPKPVARLGPRPVASDVRFPKIQVLEQPLGRREPDSCNAALWGANAM